MLAVRRSWSGVMHRADYWPRFFGEFSLASDPNDSFVPRFVGNFLRALTILYFFCLIRFGVIARGYQDPDNHGDAFIEWENRFSVMPDRFWEEINPILSTCSYLGSCSVTVVSRCRRYSTYSRILGFLEHANGSATCRPTFQITAHFIPIFILHLTRWDPNRLKVLTSSLFG